MVWGKARFYLLHGDYTPCRAETRETNGEARNLNPTRMRAQIRRSTNSGTSRHVCGIPHKLKQTALLGCLEHLITEITLP